MIKNTIVKSFLMLLLFFFCLPLQAHSRVDWEETGQFRLDETPIDIAKSQDAEYTFILKDNDDQIVAYINSTGGFCLKGDLTQNWNS